MAQSRIAITGFMCSGKTTVAHALGRLVGCNVCDLDQSLASTEDRNVADIIEKDGETAFREIETRVLAELLSQDSCSVISLGGGTWTIEQNRELIGKHGYSTVWLDAPLDLCWKRIQTNEDNRPLASSYEAAKKRYDDRLPLYQLADFRIAIQEDDAVDEVANRVAAAVLRDA